MRVCQFRHFGTGTKFSVALNSAAVLSLTNGAQGVSNVMGTRRAHRSSHHAPKAHWGSKDSDGKDECSPFPSF